MKYKLTKTTKEWLGRTLFQIEAVSNFGDIKKGDLGGFIEKEENLSQDGNAWVYDDARVYGNAQIYGDACVYGNAQVYGNARVFGDAWVSNNAQVCGSAWVYSDAMVCGDARVSGNAWVCGDAQVYGELKLLLGYFFGVRRNKEEIKYVPIDENNELICKGEVEFGEEEKKSLLGKTIKIEIDGETYEAIIKGKENYEFI